jgi:bacterial/archaeal transporter family protein
MSPASKTMAWLIPTLGCAVAFGVWGIFGKLALRSLTWGDMLVATAVVYLVLAVILVAAGKAGIHPGADLGWALAAGLSGAVALVLFYLAVETGHDIATIVAISGSYPALTVILAAIVFGDPITLTKLAGVGLVVSGIVVLSLKG